MTYFFLSASPETAYAFLALFISHGFSFVLNHIVGREWETAEMKGLMTEPYSRIMIPHCDILLGAVPVLLLKSPLPLVILLVLFKILLDARFHLKAHQTPNQLESDADISYKVA